MGWLATILAAPLLIIALGAWWAGRLVLGLLDGRWIRGAGLAALLGLIFLMTVGLSAGNLALAAAVGGALALRDPIGRGPLRSLASRVLRAPVLAGAVAIEIARGTLQMTAILLGLRRPRPGLVDVPLETETGAAATLSGLIVASSPGTIVVDLDQPSRRMLVHAVDASDPERLRASVRRTYRRYQRPVLP